MADPRKQQDAHTAAQRAPDREHGEKVINVPKPSHEQQKYLEKIERATGQYDPNTVIGGPRRAG